MVLFLGHAGSPLIRFILFPIAVITVCVNHLIGSYLFVGKRRRKNIAELFLVYIIIPLILIFYFSAPGMAPYFKTNYVKYGVGFIDEYGCEFPIPNEVYSVYSGKTKLEEKLFDLFKEYEKIKSDFSNDIAEINEDIRDLKSGELTRFRTFHIIKTELSELSTIGETEFEEELRIMQEKSQEILKKQIEDLVLSSIGIGVVSIKDVKVFLDECKETGTIGKGISKVVEEKISSAFGLGLVKSVSELTELYTGLTEKALKSSEKTKEPYFPSRFEIEPIIRNLHGIAKSRANIANMKLQRVINEMQTACEQYEPNKNDRFEVIYRQNVCQKLNKFALDSRGEIFRVYLVDDEIRYEEMIKWPEEDWYKRTRLEAERIFIPAEIEILLGYFLLSTISLTIVGVVPQIYEISAIKRKRKEISRLILSEYR